MAGDACAIAGLPIARFSSQVTHELSPRSSFVWNDDECDCLRLPSPSPRRDETLWNPARALLHPVARNAMPIAFGKE